MKDNSSHHVYRFVCLSAHEAVFFLTIDGQNIWWMVRNLRATYTNGLKRVMATLCVHRAK